MLTTKIPVPYACCIIIASAGLLFYMIISATPITYKEVMGLTVFNNTNLGNPLFLDDIQGYDTDTNLNPMPRFRGKPGGKAPKVSPRANQPPPSPLNYGYNSRNLQNDWFCVFESLFINTKLQHTFHSSYENPNYHILPCHPIQFDKLLSSTLPYLQNIVITNKDEDDHSQTSNYRHFITLRRIIMLLYKHANDRLKIPESTLNDILTTMAIQEREYIQHVRDEYPIFNIHPPRSAGTSMCGWFKRAQYAQKKQSNQTKAKQRPITTNPATGRNCNTGEDGIFPYPQFAYFVFMFPLKIIIKR